MTDATKRAEMPQGTATVLDNRSLAKDYKMLITALQPGLRVLDVGCGTGAITRGIAEYVGETGYVIGIDSSEHLIQSGREQYGYLKNLELVQANLFEYEPEEKFDLIVSARVLQWLGNPREALNKLKELLKQSGTISILDYNHEDLAWQPAPPASMLYFYKQFLNWRADAGMNNRIAEDLPDYFIEAGFKEVQVFQADEVYQRDEPDFVAKAGIWTKVAESRGKQMVTDKYVTEQERLQSIEEYEKWIHTTAQSMTMKLKEVRGHL